MGGNKKNKKKKRKREKQGMEMPSFETVFEENV
jgi:hypothetical protein